jgi:hypothetical protein
MTNGEQKTASYNISSSNPQNYNQNKNSMIKKLPPLALILTFSFVSTQKLKHYLNNLILQLQSLIIQIIR